MQHSVSRQLATEDIGRLLWRFSTPAVIGMAANALYNVIDRLYVGRCVGQAGLAGFALTFPLSMILLGVGLLTGVGTATLVSLYMGKGKRRIAECLLGQAVLIYVILSAVVFPLCGWFVVPILGAFGGTPDTIPYAKSYMEIIFYCSFAQFAAFGLNHTIRADGFPKKALVTLLIGAVLNAVLDPFFIFAEFTLFGLRMPCLNLGVRGAAIATVLSQCVSAVWVLSHFLGKSATIRLKAGYMKFYPSLFFQVAGVGIAPFLLNTMGSLIQAAYNISFRHYSATFAEAEMNMAAFGIIMTVGGLIVMPVLGIAQGMQPIVGYNYGARNYRRALKAFYKAMLFSTVWVTAGMLGVFLWSRQIVAVFSNDELAAGLIAHAPHAMKVVYGMFFLVGASIIVGQFFQSTGRALISVFMSLSRQGLMLLPLILLLPRFWGVPGIWWSAPVSDLLAAAVAAWLFFRERARLTRLIAETAPLNPAERRE